MSSEQKVKDLSPQDHKLAGDIIGESFASDPVNLWVFGKPAGLARYYSLSAKELYLAQGYGHQVNGDGCSLWLPPGTKKHIPLWNSIDIALSMISNDGLGSVTRGMRVESALNEKHPKELHHYLFAIGTRPSSQGKGIGGNLMMEGLKRVDADQLPAYLESSKRENIPFYRRFGFEVIEEFTPTKDCPPFWLMRREQRKGIDHEQ